MQPMYQFRESDSRLTLNDPCIEERVALQQMSNKTYQRCHRFIEEDLKQSYASKNKFREFISKLDQEDNSEDQGIEDYKIGGYHPVHIGEVLLKRYVVIQKLGWGHFSTVWLCKDFKYKSYVAIKMQKSSPNYMQAAFDEVQILQKVQRHHNDPRWQGKTRDDTHVVGLLNSFIHKASYGDHFCMVFQVLRCNLLDIIKRYNYQGLPLHISQEIAKQILIGLDYLHRICGVIHTDIKPENVMLCLSDQEIRHIVENGQLSNNQLFAERTTIIRKLLGINIAKQQQAEQINQRPAQLTQKIQQIQEKLKQQDLTKNQRKNLKKKLRRQKKQNSYHISQEPETSKFVTRPQECEFSLESLYDYKKGKIRFNRGEPLKLPLRVKIADLGNACWKHHQFSAQIQTRQYRSPEVILGQTYNQTADMWSFGCMMYEMLTGDLLFMPKRSNQWGKNDDHLAQMQELLGKFNKDFLVRSKKSRKYFLKNGTMKRFQHLNHYPLSTVLQLKNKVKQAEAIKFSQFLLPTLIPQPDKRISANQALKSPWLSDPTLSNNHKMQQFLYLSDQVTYQKLRQRFQVDEKEFRCQRQHFLIFDGSEQDNNTKIGMAYQDKDEQFYGSGGGEVNIRIVDRSFTKLGYIGYCDGIDLSKLDSQKNWQFGL